MVKPMVHSTPLKSLPDRVGPSYIAAGDNYFIRRGKEYFIPTLWAKMYLTNSRIRQNGKG